MQRQPVSIPPVRQARVVANCRNQGEVFQVDGDDSSSRRKDEEDEVVDAVDAVGEEDRTGGA